MFCARVNILVLVLLTLQLRWLDWIFREYTFPLWAFTTSALTKVTTATLYKDENLLYMIHALLTSELSWQQNNVFYLPLYFSVRGIFFRNRLRELVLRLVASIMAVMAKVVPLFFSHKVSNGIKPLWDETASRDLIIFFRYWLANYVDSMFIHCFYDT